MRENILTAYRHIHTTFLLLLSLLILYVIKRYRILINDEQYPSNRTCSHTIFFSSLSYQYRYSKYLQEAYSHHYRCMSSPNVCVSWFESVFVCMCQILKGTGCCKEFYISLMFSVFIFIFFLFLLFYHYSHIVMLYFN